MHFGEIAGGQNEHPATTLIVRIAPVPYMCLNTLETRPPVMLTERYENENTHDLTCLPFGGEFVSVSIVRLQYTVG